MSEVTKHGGTPAEHSSLPVLEAKWHVKRDDDGFQAVVRGVSFASVDEIMRQTFGDPSMSGISTGTEAGRPYSNWGARDIGVAINMIGYDDRIEIVCVRAMTMDEVIEHLPKTLKDAR